MNLRAHDIWFQCSRARYKHIMYWVQHNGAAKLLTLTLRTLYVNRERGPSGKFTINPYTHLMHSSPFKNRPKGEEDVVWMLHHVTFARRAAAGACLLLYYNDAMDALSFYLFIAFSPLCPMGECKWRACWLIYHKWERIALSMCSFGCEEMVFDETVYSSQISAAPWQCTKNDFLIDDFDVFT